MIILGLTGGIACGKSFVSNALLAANIPVIDCDAIAKSVLEKGTPGLNMVIKTFGKDILNQDGSLNRTELGKLVFADTEKRKKLTAITGPLIFRIILWELGKHFFFATPIVVIDAPTLFETKYLVPICFKVIVVTTTPELQLERLRKRDNSTEADALNRIKAQIPLAEKEAKADILIRNDNGFDKLEQECKRLVIELNEISSSHPVRKVFVSFPGIVLVASVIIAGTMWWIKG
jgi:dephospho-CoA kinase